MGNYEQLKNAIAEVINTNGNQEITGQILQNVLQTIVSTLGENATFAGIADPTTNPGTPDAKVFYCAYQNGTYVNFDSIILNNDTAFLVNTADGWVKMSIGAASARVLEELNLQINGGEIVTPIYDITRDNAYVASNGNTTNANNYAMLNVEAEAGDIIRVNCFAYDFMSTISKLGAWEAHTPIIIGDRTQKIVEYEVTENGTYTISVYKAYPYTIERVRVVEKSLRGDLEKMIEDFVPIKREVLGGATETPVTEITVDNRYIASNGNYQNYNNYAIFDIEAVAGDVIRVNCFAYSFMSLLSKLGAYDAHTPIIIGDGTQKTIEYEVTEDGTYTVSVFKAYPYTITHITTSLSLSQRIDNLENKASGLYEKVIVWDGDSICCGKAYNDVKDAWAGRIASNNNMLYKNYAVGGGTITKNVIDGQGVTKHSVCENMNTIIEAYPELDYFVFEGGCNDADLLGDITNARFGTYTPTNFSGTYNADTFCGAMETIIYKAINAWKGAKIVYVIPHKMYVYNNASTYTAETNRRRAYYETAINICKKWGIPYIDLWANAHINPSLLTMYDNTKTWQQNEAAGSMYADGQHILSKGYDFEASIIENFLKSV